MPEEMRFLLRAGGYGLIVGVIYYVLSGEVAGTVLMVGFGLASLMLLAFSWWEWRRRPGARLRGPVWRWLLLPPSGENGGFTDEHARLPGATLAPFTVAFGTALAALALVFGPWLLAAAVIPLMVGIRGWIGDAIAEHTAIDVESAAHGEPSTVVNRR